MYGRAECSGSFSVNDADLVDAARYAFVQVRGNQVAEIGWPKRVQVQFTGDRHSHRHIAGFESRRRRAHDGFSGALAGGIGEDFGSCAAGAGAAGAGGKIFGSGSAESPS